MKKFLNLLRYWLCRPPSWRKCVHASCWDGPNAQKRMMNLLSPNIPRAEFEKRVRWMLDRGCDTAHLILANKADGEGAPFKALDRADVSLDRVRYIRKRGMGVVLWLVTDDSSEYARVIFAEPDAWCRRLGKSGLLKHASTVVLGLEMDEYGKASDWARLKTALRKVWRGKIGTHQTSSNYWMADMGDIVFAQISPTSDANAVRRGVKAALSTGKPVNMFELQRHPDRAMCKAALDAGAFGVGNW